MPREQAKDIFTDVGDQAALATCVLHIGAAFAAVHDHSQAIQVVWKYNIWIVGMIASVT